MKLPSGRVLEFPLKLFPPFYEEEKEDEIAGGMEKSKGASVFNHTDRPHHMMSRVQAKTRFERVSSLQAQAVDDQ